MNKLRKNLNTFRWLLFPESPRHKLLVHILFWAFFVASHLLFFVPTFSRQLAAGQDVWAFIAYYMRYIPLYYFLIYVYKRLSGLIGGPGIWAIIVIIAMLSMHAITMLLYYGYDLVWGLKNLPPIFQNIGDKYLKTWAEKQRNGWSVFIYDAIDLQLLVLPVSIKVIKYGFAQGIEELRWQEEKASTELRALRSRLTPHFIFNVLNSTAAELGPFPLASSYLHQAADLIRFTLYDADQDFIALEREYHYVRQYVELETMRTELRSEISFGSLPAQTKPTHSVPTLMLLTLVENAFKHSVHATYFHSFVYIDFQVSGDRLLFTVRNSVPKAGLPLQGDSGIGLRTIRRTLELKYPGEHSLDIKKGEKIF
ncbi:MAG: hypothetical protein ABS46_02220, partial [Cytophagaceae bacterium SCN 52-12]